MTFLSNHFSWEEAEHTNHRSIDNTIPQELHSAIVETAENMERVRGLLNFPIIVYSWYRCAELNKLVGSKESSFHRKGTAVDFVSPSFGSPAEIVKFLMANAEHLQYDQLIYERTWVHIGWDPTGKNRSQVLTLNRDNTYSVGLVT